MQTLYSYYICFKVLNILPWTICFVEGSVQVLMFSMVFAVKTHAGSSHNIFIWSLSLFSVLQGLASEGKSILWKPSTVISWL